MLKHLRHFPAALIIPFVFSIFLSPCGGSGGGSADNANPAAGITSVQQSVLSAEVSSPALLYAAFPAYGLWKYDGTTWSCITPDTPQGMGAAGTMLYGDFGGQGLWKYNGTSWFQLTPDNPENIVASESALYGDFGTLGLWKHDGTSWSLLTSDNPQTIAVSGNTLYGGFGALGLWKYNGTGWSWLTSDNPQNIAASGSILYGDFGTLGLWKYDGANWSLLTPDNPENIAASGSILYGDFGTLGLWKYDGSNWFLLTPDNPENIAASGTILYGDFGALGLWKYDGSNWSLLTSDNPSTLATSEFAFSMADWASTEWHFHGLASGADEGCIPGWYHGSMVVNSSGAASVQQVVDSEGSEPYSGSVVNVLNSINSQGVLQAPANEARFQMMKDKQTYIGVGTMHPGRDTGVGGYNLLIGQKKGGSFVTADLAGTWQYRMLAAGVADTTKWSGWGHGSADIDSNGLAIYSTMYLSTPPGGTQTPSNSQYSISSDGVVNSANPYTHGVMSQNKQLMILTTTSGSDDRMLYIFIKSGGSFSYADLQGNWNYFGLSSGGMLANQWQGWFYGEASIDSNGIVTWSSITRSNGVTDIPTPSTFTITTDGIVLNTYPGSSLRGVMSQDKHLVVYTTNGVGGGYLLVILQR